jgi:hypothetical protein
MNAQIVTRTAYQEVIDFLARGTTTEAIANFQVSENVKERVVDLIYTDTPKKTVFLSMNRNAVKDYDITK